MSILRRLLLQVRVRRLPRRGFAWGIMRWCALPMTCAVLLLLFASPAVAQVNTGIDFGTATGLSTQDIRVTIAKIIRAFLGFLGVIAIGITLVGGFLWMTAGGSEEKVVRAKKTITNGVIGIAIILMSFSIAHFVLTRLQEAAGNGGSFTAVGGPGSGLPPSGDRLAGCRDPGGTSPHVCSASPTSGPVGSYVTVRGFRFGAFVDGQSVVRIGGTPAPVVACSGVPNWSDNLIVVETPTLTTGRSYGVTVSVAGGAVSSGTVNYQVTTETLGPQISCLTPLEGPEGTIVTIEGKLFGETRGDGAVQFGGSVPATTVVAWSATNVTVNVPPGALSGEIRVVRGTQSSNGYPFTVTCAANAQCTQSACCSTGQCVPATACAVGGGVSGIGQRCDANEATEQCEPGSCAQGLRCHATSCRCDDGPLITDVSPQSLVDSQTGETYDRREDAPAGTNLVMAPNGMPGNYLTIRGYGFGTMPGSIVFLGQEGDADDVTATLPSSCSTAWSDTQVIVVVPQGAPNGPLRLVTADTPAFRDRTDDARGTVIEDFRRNTTERPGLCALNPSHGQINATLAAAGVQFGATRGEQDGIFFGDIAAATSAWNATSLQARVPAIAQGAIDVRVRRGTKASNAVTFTRDPEPIVPRIREITPNRGGFGQYATIRGEHFGSEVGRITFTRGTERYDLVPRFPDACRQEWWRDGEITIRIPATREEWAPPGQSPPPPEFSALGAYEVRVHPRGMDVASNVAPFTVTTDPATPGICAIIPNRGPARTPVAVVGERFGSTAGTMRFFERVLVGSADRDAFAWTEREIRGLLVPALAKTGPFRLWVTGENPDAPTATNRGSNSVQFEVRDCREGGTANACPAGQLCCGNGTCVPSGTRCEAEPNVGVYQWTFATGTVPRVPRVVESCAVFSPSPWDAQGTGGAACTNANIRVQFTMSMAHPDRPSESLDAAGASRGVQVFRCVGGRNVAADVGGDFEEAADVTAWTVVDGTHLQSAWTNAAGGNAHGGSGMLQLTKRTATIPNPVAYRQQPSAIGLPRDATADRIAYAVTAPASLITDTNGTTYTARVFVRGRSAQRNPNARAGMVIGRRGGPNAADAGWWQQTAKEIVLDNTWQELSVAMTFDRGPNAGAPGFVRLYLTAPTPDGEQGSDEAYVADFDDLAVVRQGDACAIREFATTGTVTVRDEGGRTNHRGNIVAIAPPPGGWSPGTTYEVITYGTDTLETIGATSVAKVALRSSGDPSLRLDGDTDGQEGGNYRFRFQTRASAEPCAVQRVVTTPSAAIATQRVASGTSPQSVLADATSADMPSLVHIDAAGVDDPATCTTLALARVDAWRVVQPVAPPTIPSGGYASGDTDGRGRWCAAEAECGVIPCVQDAQCAAFATTCDVGAQRCRTNFCGADRRCENLPMTMTARAHWETPVAADGAPRPVQVQAVVSSGTREITGTSAVAVQFERPRIVSVIPTASCQEACTNTVVAAMTNIPLADDAATAVRMYQCAQENCRSGEFVATLPTGPANVQICPARPVTGSDPCAGTRVSDAPHVRINVPELSPNTSYRVLVTREATSIWGVPLEGLQYDRDGDGQPDSYSWTFRTRASRCEVHRVDLLPTTVTFEVVGARSWVTAVPVSAPDRCAPQGQPLRADLISWGWNIENATVAGFTTVTVAGAFAPPGPPNENTLTRTAIAPSTSCTLQCLHAGSQRLGGICGNGVMERGEECESAAGVFPSWCNGENCLLRGARPVAQGGTCGNGRIDAGEECDAQSGTMPAWCDAANCLRLGARAGGSVCGTPVRSGGSPEPLGDGEDCDDGNTENGDGCSSQCLHEGTLPQFDAARSPNGVLARCGDGVVADGVAGRVDGGEECDLGSADRSQWQAQGCDIDRCLRTGARSIVDAGTCGNGQQDAGEQCDDGAMGQCTEGTRVGQRCVTNADCPGATCGDRQPVGGDGCSSRCLLEGSSIAARHAATSMPLPSFCGDGRTFDGAGGRPFGGEACDVGNIADPPDPAQLLEAVGGGAADATGFQTTQVRVGVRGVEGRANVVLQCGYSQDAQCPDVATNGVDRSGCCRARPQIIPGSQMPAPDALDVCRNAMVGARFTTRMDPASAGVAADVGTGVVTRRGAVLEYCPGGATCTADGSTGWVVINAAPALQDVQNGDQVVSELVFSLDQPLVTSRRHRVRLLGASDADAAGRDIALRSLDGVRFGGASWTFTTAGRICSIDFVQMTPASYFYQRPGQIMEAPFTAYAYYRLPSGKLGNLIPIAGAYHWTYQWMSTAPGIASGDANCTAFRRNCRFVLAPSAKNGEGFAVARLEVDENTVGAAPGPFVARSSFRAFFCENPWPAVVSGATWQPYPAMGRCTAVSGEQAALCATTGDCATGFSCVGSDPSPLTAERLSLAYCRDFGSQKVCRVPGATESLGARTCGSDAECSAPQKCLLALRDDLPAIAPNIVAKTYPGVSVNGQNELRKEFFFLPRGASYCSVSGDRCEPDIPGTCPPGQFCRAEQDALGLRIYENEGHLRADRWFQKQGFTDATTPLTVDGYRGVRAGRSTYVHAPNVSQGSVFTNLAVLSFNDGAVAETQEVVQQMLQGMRFTTTLNDQNLRICAPTGVVSPGAIFGRCATSGAACGTDTQCGSGGGTCTPVSCTSDAECRIGSAQGTCRAPKDKLARDVRRVEDLTELVAAVETFGAQQRRCTVTPRSCAVDDDCPVSERCVAPGPDLAAGTFVPGMSVSRWPSWQQELGQQLGSALPTDPLNQFGGSCVAAKRCGGMGIACVDDAACAVQPEGQRRCETDRLFDPQTCWNERGGIYSCPAGSYVYQYRRLSDGRTELAAQLELVTATSFVPSLHPMVRADGSMCAAPNGTTYGASGRCGDAIQQAGEECERGQVGTEERTESGQRQSRSRTCDTACRWSPWTNWSSQCGNAAVDPGEECDVGPRGGRVPPARGVAPGITTNTAYECTPTCTWRFSGPITYMRCGDNVVQAAYGEQCDGTANIAASPGQSSAQAQYACTAADAPQPCRSTGGYCGDRVVQTASGEQCDGDMTRSCVTTTATRRCSNQWSTCTSDANCAAGGTCDNIIPDIWIMRPQSPPSGNNNRMDVPFTVQPQGSETGTFRLVLETSNYHQERGAADGLDQLDRAVVESGMPPGASYADYNPAGTRGGRGLYHRMQISSRPAGTPANGPEDVKHGTVWALAMPSGGVLSGSPHAMSELVLRNIPSGNRVLRVEWDNDWSRGASGEYPFLDSNLRIYRVAVEGVQSQSCGTPGTGSACRTGAWSACQAPSLRCGNGDVDAGEQCDDGGQGRCVGDTQRVCRTNTDCGAGGVCDADADACTSRCLRNVCGDGAMLASTCVAGDAARIGQACRSSADCGRNGRCAAEQCDVGVGNWRSGLQCTVASAGGGGVCVGGTTPGVACTASAGCGGTGRCVSDVQCVDTAPCSYGRTCNYCLTNTCTVASKRGGFCGDGIVQSGANGPEICDDGSPAARAVLAWNTPICSTVCTSRCPEVFDRVNADFGATGIDPSRGTAVASGATLPVRLSAARLYDALIVNVLLEENVASAMLVLSENGQELGRVTVESSDPVRPKLMENQRITLRKGGQRFGSRTSLETVLTPTLTLRATSDPSGTVRHVRISLPATLQCSGPPYPPPPT
ncbi:IPT/TIG domain-containing protein [Candidatus Uhrbacteria bacterium]|nr:IPT/TIG domain-containing protein [Candidatus Uhrbacteria bacterium]